MTPQARAAGGDPAAVSLACVVLTMGDRPTQLDRALRSVVAFDGAPVELVVVGNGTTLDPAQLPAGARVVNLPENLGAPGGRNVGMAEATADVVLFLDDDGWYDDPGVGERVRALFAADPRLGVVSMWIKDPDGAPTAPRHVPRLGGAHPERSSEVTTFLEGACAIRRATYLEAGEFATRFGFGHEASDFAWRALDRGWRIRYVAELQMLHPADAAGRQHDYWRDGRNRTWLVRRNLPWPLAIAHLVVWGGRTALATRSTHAVRRWAAGVREGWRTDPGPRRPISWRTAWRMTRLGRPPVV